MRKKIIITAGGTSERIDNVRKITNSSSGKLGALIASKLIELNDSNIEKIYYICSKNAIKPTNSKIEIIEIVDTNDLKVVVEKLLTTEKIDYFVMDVSFVSIEHLLPTVSRFIDEENAWICLIKPQFEVGKVYLKNGVVRDRTMHIHVLEKINAALKKYELGIEKMIVSPIYGGSGNKEFIAYIRRGISSKVNFIELCNRR